MVIVGRKGEVARPMGHLEGSGNQIPITSFSCLMAVGSIPSCRVGVPIEFLADIPNKATNTLFKVRIGEEDDLHTAFTGYITGRAGRISDRRIEAGLNLVHPARDMDTMRMLAPGMHTQGVDDWSYRRTPIDGEENSSDSLYYSTDGGKLPEQLIKGVIKRLQFWSGQEDRNQGKKLTFKQIGYDRAIALLGNIKVLHGQIDGIAGSILESTINDFAHQKFENSMDTQSSLWNSVVSIFGDFGLLVICDNQGTTYVSADLSNFQPPDENYFYSDRIFAFSQSSAFSRNVREVNLINQGCRPALDDRGVQKEDILTFASYPESPAEDDAGGSIAMAMPYWLSPLSYFTDTPDADGEEPPSPSNPGITRAESLATLDERVEKMQKALARSYYNLERDKWRTMSFSTPFLPQVVPGTTLWVQPFSSVRAMSGKQVGGGELYSGYLAEVQHHMDVQSRTLQTVLVLRNVSEASEALNVQEHPIFTDAKPFVLQ